MKEIFRDLLGYCSLQDVDPTKSNDFNKIYTFLKRHHGDATLDEFILSINDLGALQHNLKEKIKNYDQTYFDRLMITILSFAIRTNKIPMKKEVYDEKEGRITKNLTLRGILSEFYEKEQDAGSQFHSPDNHANTDFTKMLGFIDISLDSRLKIMDNMLPFVRNFDTYRILDSVSLVWETYTKRRGPTEHDKTSVDPSLGALLYMITHDLRKSPEMTVRMLTRLCFQIEELTKEIDSAADAVYYFGGSNAYLSYMSKALAKECTRYIGGNLYGGYTTEMITGMLKMLHACSKLREKYFDEDPQGTIYSTSNELQVWFNIVFGYLTRIKYFTPEMEDLLEALNRDPRYICGNMRRTLLHTTLQVSQRDGDLGLIYEWLKIAKGEELEGSGDIVPNVASILTGAICRAQEDADALAEIQENFNDILVQRIDAEYAKEEKPKDGAISVLQNDMVCRLLNTFIGAIEYERRRNSHN